jgi:pimeloyl-ACP methyl ester carboxylesterase
MHVELNDHRIWYEVEGEGTPVILVMGFGISGRAWAPQVRALRQRHQVVIFDNRGIGDSESSKTPYDFGHLADDTVALADHLGFERAHFVGVSMGGMVCQHVAVRHPTRVRSLSLIATHPGGRPHHLVPTLRGLRLFARANTSAGAKRIEALRRLLYTDGFGANAPEHDYSADSMEVFAVPADTVTRVNQVKAILKHDVTRALPSLRAPTLVVRPGADLLVRPRNSDRIFDLVPEARMLRLDRAGHGVTHQCADDVNAALLQHFDRADASSASARSAA